MPELRESIEALVKPWHDALQDPKRAQEATLERLLRGYAQTRYGAEHGADRVSSIEDYRRAFPVVTYAQIKPVIEQMMHGDTQALLYEPVVGWAMTRGTTGEPKFIPMTETDLKGRALCGARGVWNYLLHTGHYSIAEGYCLNQTFPSIVDTIKVGDREITYGYSSGIYARYCEERTPIKLVPRQSEVDALGGGTSERDWERRFELVYQQAKDEPVTMLVGVTQTMIHFGRFLKKRYGLYPKDVWRMQLLMPSSIAGIHYKYKPALRALYGDVDVVEMYGATEGSFSQQFDERPYVVPNYDVFFFEVEVRGRTKMLYELKRDEVGSLVVSTPTLPRYKIGDLILSFGGNYFRCIGREKPFAYLRYLLDVMWNWDFGRL